MAAEVGIEFEVPLVVRPKRTLVMCLTLMRKLLLLMKAVLVAVARSLILGSEEQCLSVLLLANNCQETYPEILDSATARLKDGAVDGRNE